jgi:trehalose 6-phosphate phosphatase
MQRGKRRRPESSSNKMRSLLGDWAAVAGRLHEANSVALFLDFDGTLAPLKDDPREVVLNRAARTALMRLAGSPGVRVCIISGRRLADLRTMVGVPGVSYMGVHGGESFGKAGGEELPQDVARIVAEARRELTARLNGAVSPNGSGNVSIEDKGMAFAVHHRRAQAEEAAHAREILGQVVEQFGGALWIVTGDRVWEVLPREIRGKGYAARRQWRLQPAGALPIYIGNDDTDETAFGTLAAGLTARVGAARKTRARYFLRNPAEVGRFLEKLGQERMLRS